MARPQKHGLDYIDLPTCWDGKMELIIAQHGHEAIAVYITALQIIGKESGYYADYNTDFFLVIKARTGISIAVIEEILESCFQRNVFDESVKVGQKVITSSKIQHHYLYATRKRKGRHLLPKIDLTQAKCVDSSISGAETQVNGAETGVSGGRSTQKKRKEKKPISFAAAHSSSSHKSEQEKLIAKTDSSNLSPPGGGSHDERVKRIFDYWVQVMGKTSRTKLTKERQGKIKARLNDKYTESQICEAIDGCSKNPHNMGHNANGVKYNDLELICRNATKLESFWEEQRVQGGQQAKQERQRKETPFERQKRIIQDKRSKRSPVVREAGRTMDGESKEVKEKSEEPDTHGVTEPDCPF